jgi:thiosulfate dehydrogenase
MQAKLNALRRKSTINVFKKRTIMSTIITVVKTVILGSMLLLSTASIADEFSEADVKRWQQQFMDTVAQGRQLWTSPIGSNGVVCAQCHPNAGNTHPETYPKFQKQLGKVAPLWEMINWCLKNPLEGQPLAADDPKMIALQAYVTYERRGIKLEPGKH